MGFLQPAKKNSTPSGSLEGLPQKLERPEFLWQSKQEEQEDHKTSDKPKLSFFKMAQAKRLQVEAENAASSENGTMEKPSTSGNNPCNNTETLTEKQTPQINAVYSAQNSISPSPEPQASTSGCGLTRSEGLTCPVCFSQVNTTDLNIFNSHIDHCLKGRSTRQDQNTDSESDLSSQNTDIHCLALDKHNSEENQVNSPIRPQHAFSQANPLKGRKSRDVTLNSDVSLDLEQPNPREDEGSILICPVCHKTQDTDDLTAFNHHVDLCLNQEVLQKLEGKALMSEKPASFTVNDKVTAANKLLQKNTKGKTKRRDSPSSPPKKKAKGHGPRNTIDRFFR